MNKLISALQRLYFLPDQLCQPLDAAGVANPPLNLLGPDGMVRAMLIHFGKTRDWPLLGELYQAVQSELDLPAPAISVTGHEGYELWFSLAEPVPLSQAQVFLEALRAKYLSDIPAHLLQLRPVAGTQPSVPMTPALHQTTGQWSAYIDPSLGSLFIDEPWLEMAPNMDQQASILGGLKSMTAGDFQRALKQLQIPDTAVAPPAPALVVQHYSEPMTFLLAVMNDASASPRHRIKAAKALLPYLGKAG